MSALTAKLDTFLSSKTALSDPAQYGEIIAELQQLARTEPSAYETYRDRFSAASSDLSAALSLSDQNDTLQRSAQRIAGKKPEGTAVDTSLGSIYLGTGLAAEDWRGVPATTEEEAKVPASYRVTKNYSGSDQLVMFEGDPARETILAPLDQATLRTVYKVLSPLQQKRQGNEDYIKQAPATRVEVALEVIKDLHGALKLLETRDENYGEQKQIKSALTALLGILNRETDVVDLSLLNGFPPEAYTANRELIIAYYQVFQTVNPLLPFLYSFRKGSAVLSEAMSGVRKISHQSAGNANDWLDSLAYLYHLPDVKDFIETIVSALQEDIESPEAQRTGFYSQGFEVLEWLKNPAQYGSARFKNYFQTSAISQPLVLLTQLAWQLYQYNRGFQPTPAMVAGASGHSQGIMSAIHFAEFNLDKPLAQGAKVGENISRATAITRAVFWQGLRMQQVVQGFQTLPHSRAEGAGIDLKEETPSPMAFVLGLSTAELQQAVHDANSLLPHEEHIYLSIDNSPTRKSLSGPVTSLAFLKKRMDATVVRETKLAEQHRLERLPLKFQWSWLTTTAPFHSPYMGGNVLTYSPAGDEVYRPCKELILEDWQAVGFAPDPAQLKIAVWHGLTGADLRELSSSEALMKALISMQATEPVGYQAVSARFAGTNLVDIGPKEGVLGAVRANFAGAGIRFLETGGLTELKTLFTPDVKILPPIVDFAQNRNRVVQLPDGSLAIDGPYTRFVHKPPVLVGGMTPTTGSDEINVVTTNYGYHIEVAGGAQGTGKMLGDLIDKITEQLNPGESITINLLYLATYVWSFLKDVKEKIAEGKPITGLTIAAGLPVPEEMQQLLNELNDLLVYNISLKPGTQAGFDTVIKIAEANPHRQIVTQIELGAAGGHHSWESLELLRSNYRKLREQPNLIIMIGGGIRNQEDAANFMDGTWNTAGNPMPMDGVFLGTRLMAVSQAYTSPQVKDHLVAIPGIAMEDFMARGAYQKSGTVTAMAGDGEAIHHADNKAVKVMKWLERNAKPEGNKPEQEAPVMKWLADNRVQVIDALNATQKPYFVPVNQARDPDYKAHNLTDMTYEQVLGRLVSTMKMPDTHASGVLRPDEKGWKDFSLRNFLGRMMEHMESRVVRPTLDTAGLEILPDRFFQDRTVFLPSSGDTPTLYHYPSLEEYPLAIIADFFAKYPELKTRRMDDIDVARFAENSSPAKYRMKPLPFIWRLSPRIWNEYATDALSWSQVRHFPADAVLPEPGPVAVAGIPSVDEDIRVVLDNFNQAMIHRLLVRQLGLSGLAMKTGSVQRSSPKPAALAYQLFAEALSANPNMIIDVRTIKANPQGESTFEVDYYLLAPEIRAEIPKAAYLGGAVFEPANQATFPGIKRLASTDTDPANVQKWEITDARQAIGSTGQKGTGQSAFAQFIQQIAVNDAGHLSAILAANVFFAGKTPTGNYVRDAMRPRPGQSWHFTHDERTHKLIKIELYDSKFIRPVNGTNVPVMVITADAVSSDKILVQWNHPNPTATSRGQQDLHQLVLSYDYHARQGYAPIHEDPSNTDAIREFYSGVLFDELAEEIKIDQAIVNEDRLTKADIRRLLGAFSDQSTSAQQGSYTFEDTNYRVTFNIVEIDNSAQGKRVRVKAEIEAVSAHASKRPPLIAWMKVAWKGFIQTQYAQETQGNLFKLLHFSAGFDASALARGDTAGAPVTTEQEVYIRGNYAQDAVVYYRNEKLNETVELKSVKDVARLESQAWFSKVAGVTLKLGDVLRFEVSVLNKFTRSAEAGKTTKEFSTTGVVYRGATKVGEVNFNYPNEATEPTRADQALQSMQFKAEDLVALYLKDNALQSGAITIQSVGEKMPEVAKIPLSSIEVVTRTPKRMADYAMASRDLNPIHTNPYIAAIAGLSAPIVHGMWTYGEAARILVKEVADGQLDRLLALSKAPNSPNFLDKLSLDEELVYVISHTGNRGGDAFYTVQAYRGSDTDRATPVFMAQAQIAPAKTIDIFTGQGSARLGMFSDWAFSPAAQEVIETANRIMIERHGFSLKQVVEKGGYPVQGGRFMIQADGQQLTAPDKKSILDLTQFQQVALVTYAVAAYKAIDSAGSLSKQEMIAGHSLGEYAALVAQGILRLEDAIEIVYQRGKTMQSILSEPQFKGKNFRMYSVKPHYFEQKTGQGFETTWKKLGEKELEAVVAHVREQTGYFVQVVNYNGQDQSYAVAGDLRGLTAMGQYLAGGAFRSNAKGGFVEIEGIMVPFHSVLLIPGVPKFRQTLADHLPATIRAKDLAGRYLPNLVGEKFSVSREFIQKVYDLTLEINTKYGTFLGGKDYASQPLKALLDDYDNQIRDEDAVARILLIELLAYQFANPVQWIKTQNNFVAEVGRIREIGADATLKNMFNYAARKQGPNLPFLPKIQSTGLPSERAAILANVILPSESEQKKPTPAVAPKAEVKPEPVKPPVETAPAPESKPAPVSGNYPSIVATATSALADAPALSVRDAATAIIAIKLKKPISEVTDEATIDALAGGNSTLGNQTVADLAEEFGLAADDIANPKKISIKELISAVKVNYKTPGSVMRSAFDAYVVKELTKLGLDRQKILEHLLKERLLPANHQMNVMGWLAALGRGGFFAGVSDLAGAKDRLDQAVDQYAVSRNLAIPRAALLAVSGGGNGEGKVSSKALEELEKKYFGVDGIIVQTHLDAIAKVTGQPWQRLFINQDAERVAELEARVARLDQERIREYERFTGPIFSAPKIIELEQNWGPTLVEELFTGLRNGRFTSEDVAKQARLTHELAELKAAILRQASLDVVDQIFYHIQQADTDTLLPNGEDIVVQFSILAKDPAVNLLQQLRAVYEGIRAGSIEASSLAVRLALDNIKRGADAATLSGVRTLLSQLKNDPHKRLNNHDVLAGLLSTLETDIASAKGGRSYQPLDQLKAPLTELDPKTGSVNFAEQGRRAYGKPVGSFVDFVDELQSSGNEYNRTGDGASHQAHATLLPPYVSIRDIPVEKNGTEIQPVSTDKFLDILARNAKEGMDFTGKTVWLSGASAGSIAEGMLKFYLAGGATVVVSHYGAGKRSPQEEIGRYKGIYRQYRRHDAKMYVVPMNQANQEDVLAVKNWMASRFMAPDIVLPFGAITPKNPENQSKQGYTAAMLDVLAMSATWMATAAGELKEMQNPKLVEVDGEMRPAPRGDYQAIRGAKIGWTNTPLMKDMAIVAGPLEKDYQARTFMPEEIAFLTCSLVSPEYMTDASRAVVVLPLSPNHAVFGPGDDPYGKAKRALETLFNEVEATRSQSARATQDMMADFTGRFEVIPNMAGVTSRIRQDLNREAESAHAVYLEGQKTKAWRGEKTDAELKAETAATRRAITADWEKHFKPAWKPSYHELKNIARSRDIGSTALDLNKTMVIVGIDEVSPLGNRRLHRQYALNHELDLEGSIELARLMHLITWKADSKYTGWWHVAEDRAIADVEVKDELHSYMMDNWGVRFIDPEVAGFDPTKLLVWAEKTVGPNGDDEIYASEAEARKAVAINREIYGYTAEQIFAFQKGDAWSVHFPANSPIRRPEFQDIDRNVAGQIPKGWDPTDYGIPEKIIKQVDRVTLYGMIATILALIRAGITDYMEVAAYFGLDQIGSTFGTGMGGANAKRDFFTSQLMKEPGQDDATQEALDNIPKSWIMMVILCCYNKTQSTGGACAQSTGALEQSNDNLLRGSARMMHFGGVDDSSREGANGFMRMGATASTAKMLAQGKTPKEQGSANDGRRINFTEAHGGVAGFEMSAANAIKLGLPIDAVVALAESASDGAGESIPAPGQGLLRLVAQVKGALLAFGLDGNHLDLIFQHGTSTLANDWNEAKFFYAFLTNLGRAVGNKANVRGIKDNIGHGKGATGVLQVAQAIETLNNGKVPGTPNLIDLDPQYAQLGLLTLLHYADKTLDYGPEGLMAAMVTNFGFGHEGTLILLINRVRVLMALSEPQLTEYYAKLEAREQAVFAHQMKFLLGKFAKAESAGESFWDIEVGVKPFDTRGLSPRDIELLEGDYLLHPGDYELVEIQIDGKTRKVLARKKETGIPATGDNVGKKKPAAEPHTPTAAEVAEYEAMLKPARSEATAQPQAQPGKVKSRRSTRRRSGKADDVKDLSSTKQALSAARTIRTNTAAKMIMAADRATTLPTASAVIREAMLAKSVDVRQLTEKPKVGLPRDTPKNWGQVQGKFGAAGVHHKTALRSFVTRRM